MHDVSKHQIGGTGGTSMQGQRRAEGLSWRENVNFKETMSGTALATLVPGVTCVQPNPLWGLRPSLALKPGMYFPRYA